MAAETLSLQNFPQANLAEQTQLNADLAAAGVTLTVLNTDNFAADDFIVIGRPGDEEAEIRRVQSATGTSIVITAAVTFAHKKLEQVTKVRGDKIKVYRATNVDGSIPADSSFASIATVTIEVDQPFTYYTAATGGSGYWWKQTFYNSVSLAETELSVSPAVRGGDYGHYATLEEVRLEAGFKDTPEITDQMISDRRDDAESQVKGALKAAKYVLPLTSVPAVVKNATKLIAAGYLLLQEYGSVDDGTNKEGERKKRLGEELLEKIMSKDIILVDIEEEAMSSSSVLSGWPDDSTADADEDDAGGARMFTIKKIY